MAFYNKLFENRNNKQIQCFIDKLLFDIDSELESLSSWEENIEKPDFTANTVVYKKYDDYTIEEKLAQINSKLSTIENIANRIFYNLEKSYSKKIEKLNWKLLMVQKQLQAAKVLKAEENSSATFTSVLTKIAENNYSTTRENIKEFMSISYSNFIDEIRSIPLQHKIKAYWNILGAYILDCKNGRFSSNHFAAEIADDIHNLPYFLSKDLKGFKEDWFWEPIFHSKTKNYFLEHFLSGIVHELAFQKKNSQNI